MNNTPRAGEIYFEFFAQGAYVKTIAIDAATGTEVSIVAPKASTRAQLEDLALKKLFYVLGKTKKNPDKPKGGPGILV